ncbi:hypothetical protein M0812_30265 [Anaeramoeba flamelloides]|uniref:Transposase n=1 Tax=Anaeramoeba flamelloides TaxID=1746091 RepID=A0AAV7Y5A4_9EUKA|nr:hypothetical protein M0812_30265 [Anaeramoeba flamelloides]
MLLHCKKLLEETLLEYEIDWQQITNFVTDGARACVSLGRRLNEQYAIQHTLCAAHLLHLISQKLMESFPNINGLSERWGKIMDFLNKIRRYKPRWEDANRIIYTHFYLCPEHIKPLIEDENKLCDKMRKYLRGDLIGQFIDFQNFFDEKR